MKDWCTLFPDFWFQWYLSRFYIPMMRVVYIGDCCEDHDDTCSTSKFIKCLREKHIVGAILITIGGFIGCAPQKAYKWIKRKLDDYQR